MNEENTKRKLIEPLLELLEWDILSEEVELEYSVRLGSGTHRVDYALKIDETPAVLVEAKGLDTTLTEDHIGQLKSYMRQTGVDWGLLSNGQTFEVLKRRTDTHRPDEISLGQVELDDLEADSGVLQALSKESIKSGESHTIAQQIEVAEQAVSELRSNKDEIASEVTEVVIDRLDETVSQTVEEEAKSFVDTLIETFEEQGRPYNDDANGGGETESESQSESTTTDAPDEYSLRLIDPEMDAEVASVAAGQQAEAMAALVDHLCDAGLRDQISIPYLPGTGQGHRVLLNDVPEHPDGKTMRTYEQLDCGLYLYTSLNAKTKQRYSSELAEHVGYEVEFGEGWTAGIDY